MEHPPTIDRLLNLVPDSPDTVLNYLRTHPQLASGQDAHGYSLVHAATSYGHGGLLRALIHEYHVDPNILDEDGETALFNAESVDIAKELLQLGVKLGITNGEGQTAAEKLDDPDEQPLVAAYLKEAAGSQSDEAAASALAQTGGSNASSAALAGTLENGDSTHRPPPLPNGVKVNVGTMNQGEEAGEPDPEFRRRIEELAAREDFQGEDSQRELRNLITDAVSGLSDEDRRPTSIRRLG